MGRPTKYTNKIGDEICVRLSGGESLRSICLDDHIPHRSNVFKWLLSDSDTFKKFRDQYALARRIQAECMFDDICYIADNEVESPLVLEGKLIKDDNDNTVMIRDMVGINHAKLMIDSRKWCASKLLPKKYGDKPEDDQEKEAPSLNVNFTVNDAVGEVKVTNANS